MKTDREKLLALLVQGCREERGEDDIPCCEESFCKDNHTSCYGETADYLLAHGVVVREKGEWVHCNGKSNLWYCSKCGEKIKYNPTRRTYNIEKKRVDEVNKLCRNCGADMRKGENG